MMLSCTACVARDLYTWSEMTVEPAACRPFSTAEDSSILEDNECAIFGTASILIGACFKMLPILRVLSPANGAISKGTYVHRRAFWMWLNFVFNRYVLPRWLGRATSNGIFWCTETHSLIVDIIANGTVSLAIISMVSCSMSRNN